MYIRLFDFVAKNEILSPHQYDFRPNRSTYMAINDLYCKIIDDLDNKHHSLGTHSDIVCGVPQGSILGHLYTLTISLSHSPPPVSLFSPMILISFFSHKDPVQLEKCK